MSENKAPLVEARMPTKFGTFRLMAFSGESREKENLALVMGNIDDGEILLRLHSECFTGDVLHSMRCDCGEQLDLAMERIANEGKGMIIYLRQEGRGIGLVNKLKAYNLQDDGLDTVEANVALGFDAELRDYSGATSILKNLGAKKIKLMTNNPAKVEELAKDGFDVRMVEHKTAPNEENKDYLDTKAKKMNHEL